MAAAQHRCDPRQPESRSWLAAAAREVAGRHELPVGELDLADDERVQGYQPESAEIEASVGWMSLPPKHTDVTEVVL